MRRRVIICLGVLLVLFLAGNITAMYCLDRSIAQLSALAESHRIQSLRAELAYNSARVEAGLLASWVRAEVSSQSLGSAQSYLRSVDDCMQCHHTAEIRTELQQLRKSVEDYLAVLAGMEPRQHSEVPAQQRQLALSLADRLVGQSEAMAERARRHLEVRSSQVAAGVNQAWWVLCITFAAALVVGGVVAYHLHQRLSRPLEQLLGGIKQVQKGNLGHRFAVQGDAEFQTLATAFDQAYASLKSARDSIYQAEKMAAVGKLAAGVAHEVSNPLASISSVVQMMRRNNPELHDQEDLTIIMNEVARISKIVRDLLAFSRPSVDGEFRALNVSELVDRAVTLLAYDKRARHVEIVHRRDDPVAEVWGSSDLLTQVFTNVVINAFDAICSDNGSRGRLDISTQNNNDTVHIKFADDGPGIPDKDLAKVFDPFFTTKQPGEGTGLGLWICYQIIQQHNGRLSLESRKNQGTAVSIDLPKAQM